MRPPVQYRSFNLPSRGVLYNGLLPDGTVEIRKLTVGEELVIQSNTTDLVGKLIDACVKLPQGVDATQLLIGDRLALFMAMRVQTFGPKYKYTYRCPHCTAQNEASADISSDTKPQLAAEGLKEPIEVELPDAGCKVALRFIRGRDEAQIAKVSTATTMKSNDASDPSMMLRMSMQLIAVDGEPVPDQAGREEFVKYLTMTDAFKWRDAVDKIEPGVNLDVTSTCKSCGQDVTLPLPFTSEFFRPS